MRSNRVIATAALAVLVSLVVAATTIELTSEATPSVNPARLVLGSAPPRTLTALLTFSESDGVTASASCAIDFVAGTADASATVTLSIATVALDARLGAGLVALDVAQFESLVGAPWISVAATHEAARLRGLATFFRHPLAAVRRSGRRAVTTTSHGVTTTTLRATKVHLPSTVGLPITLPRVALVVVTLTTGHEGQLLSLAVALSAPHDQVHARLLVTAYDVPLSIALPTGHDVVPLTGARARAVFGTNAASVARYLRRLGALRL